MDLIVSDEDVCAMPLQTPCDRVSDWDTYYYYDRSTGECRAVPGGECNNNRNNFYSQEQCEKYCGRDSKLASVSLCSIMFMVLLLTESLYYKNIV